MPRRAAIYVRISSDPSGERLGVSRQLTDCRALVEAKGWSLEEVFEDNDVSASTGKHRPAYQRMLSLMEAGGVDAVVAWDLDRLTRRPIEMEHFIELADRKRIALATVGGDADLSTDNGRLFARIKGAVARAEVERKSARQRAANDQRAELGQPHAGRRAYAYTSDGMHIVEAEAAEFRTAVDRLLQGESIRGIAARLNARGARTTAGNPWRPTELRRLLQNPRHAGLKVHRGVVVGTGIWPPVIDEETHRAVRAILGDPARRKAGPPRRHLLSGLATCGACGGTIYGVSEPRGVIYYCQTRKHVARRAEPVDALVREVLLARLAEPQAAADLAPGRQRDGFADLLEEERRLRAKLDGLAEAYAVGDIDGSQLRVGSRRLQSNLVSVMEALAQTARTPMLADLRGADRIEEVWDRLTLEGQRAVIDVLVTVTLHSPGRGARIFDPDSVEVHWIGE